jgi:hypothetical protein
VKTATKHVYQETRITTVFASCSCGWRVSSPTTDPQRARDLWEYHVNRVHKGEAR